MVGEHQECWLESFVISRGDSSIAKEPYNCLISQGVGIQTPVPYPLPTHLHLDLRMPQATMNGPVSGA